MDSTEGKPSITLIISLEDTWGHRPKSLQFVVWGRLNILYHVGPDLMILADACMKRLCWNDWLSCIGMFSKSLFCGGVFMWTICGVRVFSSCNGPARLQHLIPGSNISVNHHQTCMHGPNGLLPSEEPKHVCDPLLLCAVSHRHICFFLTWKSVLLSSRSSKLEKPVNTVEFQKLCLEKETWLRMFHVYFQILKMLKL